MLAWYRLTHHRRYKLIIMDALSDSSITFTSCDKIAHICELFFDITGLTYFNFVRVYKNNDRISLSNNKDWMKFVFSTREKYKLFDELLLYKHRNYIIWDLVPEIYNDELMQCAKKQFNIAHGVTLIARQGDFIEFCYFGTTPENDNINHYYVNNKDIFKAFILFFKDKAQEIILAAEKDLIPLSSHESIYTQSFECEQLLADIDDINKRKLFFEACNINRFYLGGNLKNTYLSLREAECIALLLDGFSPKEIALRMNISDRTVEKHIDSVKKKTGCSFRNELLNKLKESELHMIYESIHANHKRYSE